MEETITFEKLEEFYLEILSDDSDELTDDDSKS